MLSLDELDEYREVRAAVNERVKEVMATAEQPGVVADVVLKAASAARPKLRYTAGGLASGVNLLDSKIRNGEFKLLLPYRLPLILGNYVAGVVVWVGWAVRRFKSGDEVYPRPNKDRIGAFAEFIAINEDAVAIKPKALTMEEAASIPLVGLTAWQALIERTNLKKGQKVLIQAGSGGGGTFAIQLAKHEGAAGLARGVRFGAFARRLLELARTQTGLALCAKVCGSQNSFSSSAYSRSCIGRRHYRLSMRRAIGESHDAVRQTIDRG